jgi:hypothetical protein
MNLPQTLKVICLGAFCVGATAAHAAHESLATQKEEQRILKSALNRSIATQVEEQRVIESALLYRHFRVETVRLNLRPELRTISSYRPAHNAVALRN